MADNLQLLDDIGADGPPPRHDSRWMLVAEQPPDAERRVLVMKPSGFVMVGKRVVLAEPCPPRDGIYDWVDETGCWIEPHPVKWMPLPEGQP